MPTNIYFNDRCKEVVNEQALVNDLIVEAIQIYGKSAYYLRREDVNIDPMFYEDPLARYPHATEIELYMANKTSFAGSSEVFSKFGLVIEDQADFIVAASRFKEVEPTLLRPRENDIIFIEFTPTNRYLFEIRFVENKEQLFQLGKLYTYEIRCEMMNYSHERVQTGHPTIDALATKGAFTVDIHLGVGSGIYKIGEEVYQGTSFITALAMGTVADWNANTKVLGVQNVVGAFANDVAVVGVTSSASYMPVQDIDTAPTSHDPISDNKYLAETKPTIVQPRNNPRYQ
jgi:hypothetical protein